MRIEHGFQMSPIVEGHPYDTDPVLPSLLKRMLPPGILEDVHVDLKRFGDVVTTTMRTLSQLAGAPQLIQYNQWGQRVDELQTSEGWRGLKAILQQEGIIGIFYEKRQREYSRIYGFAKILLAAGDSQVVDCPLSMTDGCARVIEVLGSPSLKQEILPRLTSRDPAYAFTAGQWMTERSGGSDISLTETTATPVTNNATSQYCAYGPTYTLDGFKWFSSATDGDVALALARTGSQNDGSHGLSLFLIPLRIPLFPSPSAPRSSATSNNIFIHRLKNKVGTQALPTAELSLEGTEGYLIGQPGQGVKNIASVLNITRLHSATISIGSLRRCLVIALSYSTTRAINGGKQLLKDTPLHVAELAKISVLYRALMHMLFGTIALLGKVECGVATEDEALRLRLLTPAIKAFAAEKACTAMEECMTALGGAGYMSENELGRLIQDALVEKIWEGTITVLSLDLVRAATDSSALAAFVTWANSVISACPLTLQSTIEASLSILRTALDVVIGAYTSPVSPLLSRPALFLLSYVASGLYLLEHALWAYNKQETTMAADLEVFNRWVEEFGLHWAIKDVCRAQQMPEGRLEEDRRIAYGSGSPNDAVRARL